MWRIAVSWDNEEKTIVRWKFQPEWTWADVYHAIEHETELIASVTHVVDTMTDMSQMTRTPTSAFSLVKNAMQSRHERLGITVLYGSNMYTRMMYQMIATVYPAMLEEERLFLNNTEAEAYDTIKEFGQSPAAK